MFYPERISQKCHALYLTCQRVFPSIGACPAIALATADLPIDEKLNFPLCPQCLCGEKSVGFGSAEEWGELARLGKEPEDPTGVKENDPITKGLWVPAKLPHHPEKGFARVDRIKKEALG